RGIMVRVGERSPAVEMNREMERLTAVPDEMAPNADIAQDQHLAPMPILGEPRAVFGGGGALLAGARDAPIGEILRQPLPSVGDCVRKKTGLVLILTLGLQGGIECLPALRQRVDWDAERCALVIEVEKMPAIVIRILAFSGAAQAVGL